MRLISVAAAAMVLVFAAEADLQAHEIGTTRVDVTFRNDRTFEVAIAVDPETLLSRLETEAGIDVSEGLDGAAQSSKINELKGYFVQNAVAAFDNKPVPTEFVFDPGTSNTANAAKGLPRILLRGVVPPAARSFTWRYELTSTVYPLSLQHEGTGTPKLEWLHPGVTSQPFQLKKTLSTSKWRVFENYLKLGFTHILPKGLDHVLFVLSLFLLSARFRPILAQVTAFTLAHTITLALTIYEVISAPGWLVEPLIAISIAYVAIENFFRSELKTSRIFVVFGFGLLHGMGFAGVLTELGLPRSDFLTALLAFNIGVEVGQLTVIAAAFLLCGVWFKDRIWYRNAIVKPASALIALTGIWWAVERVAG